MSCSTCNVLRCERDHARRALHQVHLEHQFRAAGYDDAAAESLAAARIGDIDLAENGDISYRGTPSASALHQLVTDVRFGRSQDQVPSPRDVRQSAAVKAFLEAKYGGGLVTQQGRSSTTRDGRSP